MELTSLHCSSGSLMISSRTAIRYGMYWYPPIPSPRKHWSHMKHTTSMDTSPVHVHEQLPHKTQTHIHATTPSKKHYSTHKYRHTHIPTNSLCTNGCNNGTRYTAIASSSVEGDPPANRAALVD